MAFCNVKQNSINHIKEKGYVDSNMIVTNPMFFDENKAATAWAWDFGDPTIVTDVAFVRNPKYFYSANTLVSIVNIDLEY